MTRINIFSNGGQYGDWITANCQKCIKSRADCSACDIELALTYAYFDDGMVSKEIADRMNFEPLVYNWECGDLVYGDEDGNENKKSD